MAKNSQSSLKYESTVSSSLDPESLADIIPISEKSSNRSLERQKPRRYSRLKKFLATTIVASLITGGVTTGAVMYNNAEKARKARWEQENKQWAENFADDVIYLEAGANLRCDSIGGGKYTNPNNPENDTLLGRPDFPIALEPNEVLRAGYNANGSWYELTPEAVERLRELGVKIDKSNRVVVNEQTINIPQDTYSEIRSTEAYEQARK